MNVAKSYLLLQRIHRLTSDAMAAFPVGLVFIEEYGSSSKSMFLQYPATLIHSPVQNILIEIIDHVAYVERSIIILFPSQSDIVPLQFGFEKPIAVTAGATRSNDTFCAAVDLFHSFGLLVEIHILTFLDNTNRIDPEVTTLKSPCYQNSISKSGW